MSIESPLIGSGSQEEVDLRVNALIDLGTSRGYLTYEELNERLPDEVVSPDKLDSLLMMIDEMGIRLIDEFDVAEFNRKGKKAKPQPATPISTGSLTAAPSKPAVSKKAQEEEQPAATEEDDEEIDLTLEEELAEATTKRIDD